MLRAQDVRIEHLRYQRRCPVAAGCIITSGGTVFGRAVGGLELVGSGHLT